MLNISYLYDQYEVLLYTIQQTISSIISLQSNIFSPLTIILIFLSGLLTSLNPCFISVLPLSVSYITTSSKK
uniref:Thiol:disulfide interchange protein n=1 Tax=Haraldiophyllum bonnemaisonii TaxID=167977 RepID=A0A4D6WWB7_9FLOR|nr:Thiol:disulfide interchange protein [Haraldiophyllum bonnemaisonii]